jgi:hypothetical protein
LDSTIVSIVVGIQKITVGKNTHHRTGSRLKVED